MCKPREPSARPKLEKWARSTFNRADPLPGIPVAGWGSQEIPMGS